MEEEFIWSMIAHRRFKYQVINKVEFKFVVANKVYDIRYDELIGTCYVIEVGRKFIDAVSR